MSKKITKEEYANNPTIEFHMINGELVIKGNPFNEKEKDVQSNTKRKVQREKDRSEYSK